MATGEWLKVTTRIVLLWADLLVEFRDDTILYVGVKTVELIGGPWSEFPVQSSAEHCREYEQASRHTSS